MTCRETQQLVMPYINNDLTDEELAGFLKHIDTCSDCKEELEIYFTVAVGIQQLDEETDIYNIKGALDMALELSGIRVKKNQIRSIVRISVNTLSIMSLIVTFLLQCRVWWQQGLF